MGVNTKYIDRSNGLNHIHLTGNINFLVDLIIALTTGSIVIMWFSEIITEYGIGNGASLIIFQNIVSNIPKSLKLYEINIGKKFTGYLSTIYFMYRYTNN